ncbi:TPA: ead/Ea22-like family protein [Klebsiella quasipneumoniae]|nr:ead/Ea22-like family protein [Klebsiella quasipneumoniae]
MTTDITELAQREKFEAWWERTQHNGNPPRFGWECWRDGGGYKVDDDESELDGMWEAWKAAGAELVEALEKAQRYIERLREWNAGLAQESCERQQLISELEPIRATAEKLVRCKGRYHSEQNYRALAALFGVKTPDLPPLEHENVHYADAAEMEIVALRQRIAELEFRTVKLPDGWQFEECEIEGCENGAIFSVGTGSRNIHLCDKCAHEPQNSRLKKSPLSKRLPFKMSAGIKVEAE